MIDFTAVKFDDERQPYIVERGAKGKFTRRYLDDGEQQAHKEWEDERVRKLNAQAVAPARGQTKSFQHADTIGTDRSAARIASYRGFHEGATGVAGGCAGGPIGGEPSAIPPSIESNEDQTEIPIGQRVARRSVNLMDSVAHLTNALYEFGAIDNSCPADLRARIMDRFSGECISDRDNVIRAEDELEEPYFYIEGLSQYLCNAYTQSRTQAPLKVVGYHAAPMIVLAQYLMGLLFPEGDMARRAQSGDMLGRGDENVYSLALDLLTVYNNIQADLSHAGNTLLGVTPEEIGEITVTISDLSQLDVVHCVDEMLEYLTRRIDGLTELLNERL
ncbi:hypothetical protein pEaSNUABM40_00074 [Erwinia phage pEa_SNUABM_40]|uniref:Uncharacterized protein n=1 Tax=Erwinia phage pEa_SNUABM_3 TaxID=2869552 RepID=A0AAE7XHA0_9CAUD|nr:hypothetical protein MPK68_gp074 [Erwinia phage pEa_SNUABM_3]QZE56610.1 hypothetical protein pEaSNUABM20_00074 [Erwinia phage pEa_SNUABM_20]QZE58290.1 hypothetical protein pEaSNUABM40_00074 [Erwinia phage pEa_SNUABM_40]UAW52855.1 hypothetical protein pEaSNUABM23_00073 [Erwinia phage pEa_SNUABM_23]UIW10751.1 hypothetical protein pEaSNUABM23_00073 [Erwinia phage pEa_SNUABM_31]QZE56271.1 hypothetical protein pEaSNUABM3_00074 [Erwinia phage pEa_SNUABM_3]